MLYHQDSRNSPVGFSTTTDVGVNTEQLLMGLDHLPHQHIWFHWWKYKRKKPRSWFINGWCGITGATNTTQIKYFDIASEGITEDFGQTTSGRRDQDQFHHQQEDVSVVVVAPTSQSYSLNTIDFVTMQTQQMQLVGDIKDTAYHYGTTSNQTRGLFAGGYRLNNSAVVDTIDLITIATTGNASTLVI